MMSVVAVGDRKYFDHFEDTSMLRLPKSNKQELGSNPHSVYRGSTALSDREQSNSVFDRMAQFTSRPVIAQNLVKGRGHRADGCRFELFSARMAVKEYESSP